MLNQVAQHLFARSAKNTVALVVCQIALDPFNIRRDAVKRGTGPSHRLVSLEGVKLAKSRHTLFDYELRHSFLPISGRRITMFARDCQQWLASGPVAGLGGKRKKGWAEIGSAKAINGRRHLV